MTAPIADLTSRLKSAGAITPDDTLAVRRAAWPDGRIDPAEADAIFDLNGTVAATSREWIDFFVEAMSVYVVRQQQPTGYVDDAKAVWLIAKIDHDGRIDSLGELELLVKVVEDATSVPESLRAYVLRQIESTVLTGTGPTRDGGCIDPHSITATEVKLLRRVIFAQAGDGPGSVGRAEADLLFRLKDATLDATNAPEWKTLFVQGVGNHLMAHTSYRPLDRDTAVGLDTFMNDTGSSVLGFFGRVARSDVREGLRLAREPRETVDHAAAVAADRAVTRSENDWLTQQLDADQARDPLEEALLAFIAEESATLRH